MAREPKISGCVEMKGRAQEQLLAEYEARKGEFAGYWQFIGANARESEFWGRFRTTRPAARAP